VRCITPSADLGGSLPGIALAVIRATGRNLAGPTNKGEIVKKLDVLVVTVAMLFAPLAFADKAGGVVQNPNRVLGEKLDSGLGNLTQAEIDRIVAASKRKATASNGRSGSAAVSLHAALKADYRVPPSNEGE
jgi:hypothetical protein